MKICKILTIVTIIVMYFVSCMLHSQNITKKINNTTQMYQIKKIKKDKSLYVIYALRNDSIFKIISNKESSKNCQNKIKAGGCFNLNLNVTFPLEKSHGAVDVLFSYKKSIIKVEKESHYKIYIADNLKGLCLIND